MDVHGAAIGFVGLDTSHPSAYADILSSNGARLQAVHVPAECGGRERAAVFARRFGVATVADSPDLVARHSDVVFVSLSDQGIKRRVLREIAAVGTAMFVDKPLGWSPADWSLYSALAASGARITGGSSLQWTDVQGVRARRGRFLTRGHVYSYGLHATALAAATMGADFHQVVDARFSNQVLQFRLALSSGCEATITVDTSGQGGVFRGQVEDEQARFRTVNVDPEALPRTHLERTLPYLLDAEPPAWSIDELCMSERATLAAIRVANTGRAFLIEDDQIDERSCHRLMRQQANVAKCGHHQPFQIEETCTTHQPL